METNLDNLRIEFSALNADFSSPSIGSSPHRFKDACAGVRQRGVPL